jgi:hypothetical protein
MIWRVTTGTGLAIGALVVSGVSLGWNVVTATLAFPRVAVAMRKHVSVNVVPAEPDSSTTRYRFRVSVINIGGAATTIADIGLRPDPSTGTPSLSVEKLRTDGETVTGPELPGRLEGHGSMSWDFKTEHLVNIPDGVPFYAYAERYKPIRRWVPRRRRTMIKSYESPFAEMKAT